MVALDDDQATPLADTPVKTSACNVPNVCGAGCPHVKRRLPCTRTYYIAVKAAAADACGGGKYKLVVVSPSGTAPVLIADDVDASGLP